MTKTKSTKRALLASVMALFLCFSMLLGTTFAWFTDSVTSGNNIIKSGTLDVEMYWADGTEAPDSATWTDASTGTIFNYDKWEPGYVEVRHIKIANVGTLALKYQIKIVANGEVSDLADVIDVYYVDPAQQIADRTDLTDDNKLGTLTDVLANLANTANGELPAGENDTITLALKMQETAGNEYQNKSIGTNFSVQLLATQLTSEKDSFDDQYDKDAPYSLWNGVVPTEMPASLVVDGATQTVHVKDAAAFAYLSTLSAKWVELYTDGNGREWSNYANGAGADYYFSGKWTVSLEADIDLGNHSIAPVDIKLGESTGASAFNGNGHIIRNINATTGLFADGTRATFSNFTLENVKATRGALIGSARNGITNVTVKNATISGTDYVGGLVGSAYSSVTGCKVIDSSITATGKEAGAMIGYIEAGTTATVAYNNTVNNVNVYAGNRAAGLVAQVNDNVKVYNNIIDIVTVGAADTTTYQPGAVVSNAIAPENVYDNTVTNANVATKAANATDNVTLNSAIADGADTIFLGSGEYVIPDSAQGKTLTIVGNGNTVVANQNDGSYEGCDYSLDGSTVTFEGVTINTDGHTYAGYARCRATYNNCTINGSYTLYGESVFNNCTFNVTGDYYNIWTWGGKNIKFNDCTFNTDGKSILVYNQTCDVYVDGCTFNDRTNGTNFTKSAFETGVDGVGAKYNIYINDTTVNGFAENDKCVGYKNIVGNKNSMSKEYLNIVIDGVDVY